MHTNEAILALYTSLAHFCETLFILSAYMSSMRTCSLEITFYTWFRHDYQLPQSISCDLH